MLTDILKADLITVGLIDCSIIPPEELTLLGYRISAMEEYNKAHPIWFRFSSLPIIKSLYCKKRLEYILRKEG